MKIKESVLEVKQDCQKNSLGRVVSGSIAFCSYLYFQKPFPILQEFNAQTADDLKHEFLFTLLQALLKRSANIVFYALVIKTAETFVKALERKCFHKVLRFQAVLGGVAAASFQKKDLLAAFSLSCLANSYGLLSYSIINNLAKDSSEGVSPSDDIASSNFREIESFQESALPCLTAFCALQSYYQYDDLDWLSFLLMPLVPSFFNKVLDPMSETQTKKSIWNFMLSISAVQVLGSASVLNIRQFQCLGMMLWVLPAVFNGIKQGSIDL